MDTVLNILIIEDSQDDYILITRNLKKRFKISSKRIEDKEELEASLMIGKWDVIISDNSLPNMDAIGALDITRALDTDVPFIIVSGTIGEEMAVKAMKSGANDFILKDSLARLNPVVDREIKEANNRRAKKSNRRRVTGLHLPCITRPQRSHSLDHGSGQHDKA